GGAGADVRARAFDFGDAEGAVEEGVELDRVARRRAGVVAFEAEAAMRAIAHERASELLVEAAPSAPRADGDTGGDLFGGRTYSPPTRSRWADYKSALRLEIGRGPAVERGRAFFLRRLQQQ